MGLIKLHRESRCSILPLEASRSVEPHYVPAVILNEKQRLCHTKLSTITLAVQAKVQCLSAILNPTEENCYNICMKTQTLRELTLTHDSGTTNTPKTPY